MIKRKEKQLAPEGMHLAHLIWGIDIGTHESKFGKNRKIIFSWELSECLTVFKGKNGPEPFVLSKTYNQSLGKGASLVRDLTPWIGSGFTKRASFDIDSLVGKACLVNVIHETKDGETFANIISLAPIPRGMAVPDQILPSLVYSIEDGFNGVFEQLPVWIQEKIKASEEIAGKRPSKAEIAERNVRQATANATSAYEESSAEYNEDERCSSETVTVEDY
jgi:hypothetical protein